MDKVLAAGGDGAGGPAVLRHFTAEALATPDAVPVVIQFQQAPVVAYKARHPLATQMDIETYTAGLQQNHSDFLKQLTGLGMDARLSCSKAVLASADGTREIDVVHDFTYCFNGIGLLLPGRVVTRVAALPGVASVTCNQERVYLNLNRSVPFTGATRVWERWDGRGQPLVGDGVTIAIVDTGVDWTHPAFGGFRTVPNAKVVFAASYTGEPPADNFGHGTHVAAICAGDQYRDTPRGASRIRGMAPGARLMSYKVLTAAGSGSATSIIMAIEDAVRRGAHVINLSLGDPSGDPLSPEAVAANNAMAAGVVVVAAAGNSGPAPGTVGTPGAATHVITAGASTDDGVTALFARLDTDPQRDVEMRLMSGSVTLPSGGITSPYVDCGLGQAAADFPADVRGRLAVIRRGGGTFKEKAKLAQAAGAVAAIIYNNAPGNFFGTLGEASADDPHPVIPVVSISREDGEYMVAQERDDTGVYRAGLFLNPAAVPQPDRLAEFSSRGPTRDGRIKPDLCAPGVDIDSATILPGMAPDLPGVANMADPSGYTSTSGTSMATPHIAGACALIRQAHPEWDPFTIKAVLMNTARYMDGQGTANDQGAGRMDLNRALGCRAILGTAGQPPGANHSFGLVGHGGSRAAVRQEFRLQDLAGQTEEQYRLRVRWIRRAPGMRAFLSTRTLTLCRRCEAPFTLELRINGARVPDDRYYGLLEAVSGREVLRLLFAIATKASGPTLPPGPGPGPEGSQPEPGRPQLPEPGPRPAARCRI